MCSRLLPHLLITKLNVSRLKLLQKITLGARVVGDSRQVFESHAHFIADRHGQVDVCRDPSVGGSYSEVSAMELLWSIKPAPGQRKGIRLMKSDVIKPYSIALNCFDGHKSAGIKLFAAFVKQNVCEGVNGG